MRKAPVISLGIIALSLIMGLWLYPQLPERVAIHWNALGEADGFAPGIWAVALVPSISILILGMLLLVPRIDPLRRNIGRFRPHYEGMVVAVMLFLFYVHAISLALNIGLEFNMLQALSPAFGLLFYYIGILMGRARRNWFIGIRTPWTLSSEAVWNRTHRLGGRLFRIAGIVALLGIAFPEHAIWFIIIPVLFFSGYLVLYSYLEYQKGAG
jgi:uncharacterized membrane protein